MGTIASQITSLTIVYSTVYSHAYQRKYKSSASLAFVRGIHLRPVNSPHKLPVTWKMFRFDDVILLSKLVMVLPKKQITIWIIEQLGEVWPLHMCATLQHLLIWIVELCAVSQVNMIRIAFGCLHVYACKFQFSNGITFCCNHDLVYNDDIKPWSCDGSIKSLSYLNQLVTTCRFHLCTEWLLSPLFLPKNNWYEIAVNWPAGCTLYI